MTDIEYLETFFFVTETVMEELNKNNEKIVKLVDENGRIALVDFVKMITDMFQAKNKNREWDGEFLEEVYTFTINSINNNL